MNKPPFEVTPSILNLLIEIQGLLGELKGKSLEIKPSHKLRKENRIKTVHHSLAIEGNTLDERQITAILEKKKVIGPRAQILEVQNALKIYDALPNLKAYSEKDFLKAHSIMLSDLIPNAGKYRTTAVGILKNSKVSRIAPPAKQVPTLMKNLFDFLKDKEINPLLKACVFHYELEFIHPFADGNGRMGRLWQQRILMEHSPIFEYLSVETWIHKEQKSYYKALETSDLDGNSIAFIKFSLGLVLKELKQFNSQYRPQRPKMIDRIEAALEFFDSKYFTRKDYMNLFKDISTATASRDLARAIKEKKLLSSGTKATAVYKKK